MEDNNLFATLEVDVDINSSCIGYVNSCFELAEGFKYVSVLEKRDIHLALVTVEHAKRT